MPSLWNPKGPINWSCLDRKLVDEWFGGAGRESGIARFVSSFIVLNHYYSAYATIFPPPPGKNSERREVRHLATLPTLLAFWPTFVQSHEVHGRRIELPLIDRYGRHRPVGVAPGGYEAGQLACADYLDVLYQLRCDFFHASRGPMEYPAAVRFAADPCFVLVGRLRSATTPR